MSRVQDKIENAERGLTIYRPPAEVSTGVIPYEKNQERNKIQKALHLEQEISTEVQNNAKKAKDLLISNPINSVASIFRNTVSKIKGAFNDLNSSNVSPAALRMKKYGLLALAGAFSLFTITSGMGLVKSFWNRDNSSKLLKFGDVFMKFIMTLGVGGAALGKGPFKFQNLKGVLGGSLAAFGISQLSGMTSGENNLLGKIARFTGSEETIKKGLQAETQLRPS